jgi:SAM-dependent methyltransferase
MISTKVSSVVSMFREHGLRGSAMFVYYRLYEELQERRLGIQTGGLVSPDELGHDSPELLEYTPTSYHALQDCLARVRFRTGEDAFLDYGCGLGRVIIFAATKPFSRAVGVEISTALAEKARENIEQARGRLKCEVTVDVSDARTYQVPDDVTVIHFFNPFIGDTLAQAVGNIRESLRRRPRELTILYASPGRFEKMFGGQDWLKKTASLTFYPGMVYAIYSCRADAEVN